MKDKHSLHLRVQGFCDCYVTTGPLKEMSAVNTDGDDTGRGRPPLGTEKPP